MTELSATDLLPFTSFDRHRSWLSTPFVVGEHTYACNGHFAVRIPGRHVEIDADEKAKPIAGMFDAANGAQPNFTAFAPIDAVAIELDRCDSCKGQRWVTDCDVCDATGEHQCSDPQCGCAHDCGNCNGRGIFGVRRDEKGARKCDGCGGTGREPDHRNVYLGAGLALRWLYLSRVQALPGPIEWAVPEPTPDKYDSDRRSYAAVSFRGPGWEALILPVRTFGTERITAARHGAEDVPA